MSIVRDDPVFSTLQLALVLKAAGDFAERGLQSLGVARADGEGPWQFPGVPPLFDPSSLFPAMTSSRTLTSPLPAPSPAARAPVELQNHHAG